MILGTSLSCTKNFFWGAAIAPNHKVECKNISCHRDCIRVLLTRIFGVPAKPLEYPSETERLLNISHTKMRPIPLDRLPPENILEVEDPTEGPLWDWVCYQLWRLLRVEVEDSGPVKLWIK